MEPPNPDAVTMDPQFRVGKSCSTFDTALHPRQWEFMKVASLRWLHGVRDQLIAPLGLVLAANPPWLLGAAAPPVVPW